MSSRGNTGPEEWDPRITPAQQGQTSSAEGSVSADGRLRTPSRLVRRLSPSACVRFRTAARLSGACKRQRDCRGRLKRLDRPDRCASVITYGIAPMPRVMLRCRCTASERSSGCMRRSGPLADDGAKGARAPDTLLANKMHSVPASPPVQVTGPRATRRHRTDVYRSDADPALRDLGPRRGQAPTSSLACSRTLMAGRVTG